MNGVASAGKTIIAIGVLLIVIGGIILLLSKVSGGRGHPLPGDIAIRWGNVRIYFPIVTSIVISIVLTLLFMVFSWLSRK
ncbi:MAG: DUF2905 domain-containing protein [Armatimonadetes bacterium]|nr:DUF2905 domain-containing protein [Armatimonadota bacterium]